MMYIMYVVSTIVYFILSLGENGILDLSNKDSPHKDLLGSNAFNILQKTYPPSLTSIDIFEDIVDVSDIEKVILAEHIIFDVIAKVPNTCFYKESKDRFQFRKSLRQ